MPIELTIPEEFYQNPHDKCDLHETIHSKVGQKEKGQRNKIIN